MRGHAVWHLRLLDAAYLHFQNADYLLFSTAHGGESDAGLFVNLSMVYLFLMHALACMRGRMSAARHADAKKRDRVGVSISFAAMTALRALIPRGRQFRAHDAPSADASILLALRANTLIGPIGLTEMPSDFGLLFGRAILYSGAQFTGHRI